jgi:hypothetical protein
MVKGRENEILFPRATLHDFHLDKLLRVEARFSADNPRAMSQGIHRELSDP